MPVLARTFNQLQRSFAVAVHALLMALDSLGQPYDTLQRRQIPARVDAFLRPLLHPIHEQVAIPNVPRGDRLPSIEGHHSCFITDRTNVLAYSANCSYVALG